MPFKTCAVAQRLSVKKWSRKSMDCSAEFEGVLPEGWIGRCENDNRRCPPKRILKRRQWIMPYYEDAESLDENGPLDLPAIMAQSD
jgi:hypothetical protein